MATPFGTSAVVSSVSPGTPTNSPLKPQPDFKRSQLIPPPSFLSGLESFHPTSCSTIGRPSALSSPSTPVQRDIPLALRCNRSSFSQPTTSITRIGFNSCKTLPMLESVDFPPSLNPPSRMDAHQSERSRLLTSLSFGTPRSSNPTMSDLTDTKSKSTFKSCPPPPPQSFNGPQVNSQTVVIGQSMPRRPLPTPSQSLGRNKGRSPNVANVSRSAPASNVKSTVLQTHMEDPLPIRDDMTDIDSEGSRPSTPAPKVPTRQQRSIFFNTDPRAAPSSSMSTSFPFSPSTPSPTVRNSCPFSLSTPFPTARKHHCASSDGVSFNMEDSSDNSEGLRNLFSDLRQCSDRPAPAVHRSIPEDSRLVSALKCTPSIAPWLIPAFPFSPLHMSPMLRLSCVPVS
ncbi:hypothetical protein BJ322DRAFT_840717 [Thelephora terrestris]|uniref:Uncharacterized protein n=1 Tax=Thelephora terrestris TaxID=56493 RepID=A0A9P6HEN8_9AGAM|nr:hypothetical protein BJ322DRAFT_840717 [Thelephora terrestris]